MTDDPAPATNRRALAQPAAHPFRWGGAYTSMGRAVHASALSASPFLGA